MESPIDGAWYDRYSNDPDAPLEPIAGHWTGNSLHMPHLPGFSSYNRTEILFDRNFREQRILQQQQRLALPTTHFSSNQRPSSLQPNIQEHIIIQRQQPLSSTPLTSNQRPSFYQHNSGMSQRQLHFNTLSSEERILQEEWARHQLTITGCCVAGYDWVRKEKGYRCLGGNHCVTDALLAEGDGGFYSGSNGGRRVKKGESEFWEGPYYKGEDDECIVWK
jgi:hypothetical protein